MKSVKKVNLAYKKKKGLIKIKVILNILSKLVRSIKKVGKHKCK